jgi:hypothetical protein
MGKEEGRRESVKGIKEKEKGDRNGDKNGKKI